MLIKGAGQRWDAVSLVVKCAFRRIGAKFGPALLQLAGLECSAVSLNLILGFLVELPASLLDLADEIGSIRGEVDALQVMVCRGFEDKDR